jgi:hypothetical protein
MRNTKRTERIRKQDADRQQAKRDRDAAHRDRVGAQVTKLTTYQGTRADWALMQQVGEFEEVEEVITLMTRYMAGMARRDPQAFLNAMNPRNPV